MVRGRSPSLLALALLALAAGGALTTLTFIPPPSATAPRVASSSPGGALAAAGAGVWSGALLGAGAALAEIDMNERYVPPTKDGPNQGVLLVGVAFVFTAVIFI